MHASVGLIHSMTNVLFGLYLGETRISEHIGISPAVEGWTVAIGGMCIMLLHRHVTYFQRNSHHGSELLVRGV
jgi:hypothetical protein